MVTSPATSRMPNATSNTPSLLVIPSRPVATDITGTITVALPADPSTVT